MTLQELFKSQRVEDMAIKRACWFGARFKSDCLSHGYYWICTKSEAEAWKAVEDGRDN